MTETTYYRRRSEYGGLKGDHVKRMKELEQFRSLHNHRLRRAELSRLIQSQLDRRKRPRVVFLPACGFVCSMIKIEFNPLYLHTRPCAVGGAMYSSVVIRTRAARPPMLPKSRCRAGFYAVLRSASSPAASGCGCQRLIPTFSSTAKFSRLVVAACIGRRLAQRCEADDAGR